MNVFTVAFLAYLLYVSYCKIVWLCFRGRVHNRFFAACVSTVIPVFGSIPAYIIATKYERRVGAVAPKMNGEALRLSMILLQMASCFVLFLPFLAKHGVYANGINYVYGLSVAGEIIIPELKFLSYLIIAPFVSAVINCIDIKYNIRNVITYIVSLICCLTVFILSMFFYFSEDYVMEYGMWLYCTINLTVMLLSIFSLIKVRNKFLLNLEETEMNEMVEMQKQKSNETRTGNHSSGVI